MNKTQTQTQTARWERAKQIAGVLATLPEKSAEKLLEAENQTAFFDAATELVNRKYIKPSPELDAAFQHIAGIEQVEGDPDSTYTYFNTLLKFHVAKQRADAAAPAEPG